MQSLYTLHFLGQEIYSIREVSQMKKDDGHIYLHSEKDVKELIKRFLLFTEEAAIEGIPKDLPQDTKKKFREELKHFIHEIQLKLLKNAKFKLENK